MKKIYSITFILLALLSGCSADDNNSIETLKVINKTVYSRHFHIKKQSDTEYTKVNYMVIPAGETRYYYNLEVSVFNWEADNSSYFVSASNYYSSGQVNVTDGRTTTLKINQ